MKKITLHTKLAALLIGIALIPLAVTTYVIHAKFKRTLEAQAIAFGHQLGATAAAQITSFVRSELDVLDYVGLLYHPQISSGTGITGAVLESVLFKSQNFVDISVTDKNGRQLTRKNRLLTVMPQDLRSITDSVPFLAVRQQGIYLGPAYNREGKPFFDLGRKIVDLDGDFAGGVFAQVDAKVMPLLLGEVSKIAGPGGRVYIVNDKGLIVAHPDLSYMLAERDLSNLPLIRNIARNSSEAMTAEIYINEMGHEVLGSVHPMTIELFGDSRELTRINWFVVTEQPVETVFREAERVKWSVLLIALIVAIVAGATAYFLAERLTAEDNALRGENAHIASD